MRFEIVLAPEAVEDLKALKASVVRRSVLRSKRPRHEPTKTSRSRIKRLRGISRPQYRLELTMSACFMMSAAPSLKYLRSSPNRRHRHGSQSSETAMKQVPLSEAKDDLSRLLHEAEKEEIVITRHGKPAGALIGFESEEDCRLPVGHDRAFGARKGCAGQSRAGRGVRLEDLPPHASLAGRSLKPACRLPPPRGPRPPRRASFPRASRK